MSISAADLLGDLHKLRKGPGVNTADLGDHLGPALSAACGIEPDDEHAVVRSKLVGWMRERNGALPWELAQYNEAAFGLSDDFSYRFLNERLNVLARRVDREARTVRRRMDLAMRELVSQDPSSDAPGPTASPRTDWYVDRCNAVLRLDGPSPECFEQRRIVATRDGLRSLDVSISVPKVDERTSPVLDVEAMFGVMITEKAQVTATRFRLALKLPRPLDAGESTEYGLIFKIPPGRSMRSHYAFVPERRAESFDVRVRFAPDRLPDRVWRVTGAFNRDIDDRAFAHDVVVPDQFGEVHASFTSLEPRLGYGIQWTPPGA